MSNTTLTPRTWKKTFLQGDDDWRLRELRAAAAEIEPEKARGDGAAGLMSDDDPWALYDIAAKAADDFAVEATERGVTVVLRPLGRAAWKELVVGHPPRDGVALDHLRGVNVPEFLEALVPQSIGSPALADQALVDFVAQFSDGQFEELGLAAWDLNRGSGADPKERLASAPTEI